ncbi:MAG TPA: hypothetical protein EYG68_04525 [Leucothrix mucor]|nr:hypothetical protein [Leucothrix mucor]
MNHTIKQFTVLFCTLVLNITYLTSLYADDTLWQEINTQARSTNAAFSFNNSRQFFLNEEKMQQLLKQSSYVRKRVSPTSIALPLPDGETIYVTAINSDVLPEKLAKKYPQIKTYKVVNANDNIITGRLDFTPSGFHAMLQTEDGDVIYIDPINTAGKRRYSAYTQKDQHPNTPHQCELKDNALNLSPITYKFSQYPSQKKLKRSTSSNVHNYTIAIAATGEYTQLQGGTVSSALSAIATTINRINQIYERDLGIHFTLANNNDEIIYTHASSDPYTNGKAHLLILENQRNLDSVIGSNNYDIGHVFGTSGGGVAIIENLCLDGSKAKGTSGISNPNSESFYIDFVAHEIGHQLGATHTFNSNQGLCAGNTRTSRTAFEPGSGSTIMAYTGICGADNLQQNADAMFHIGSIEQIKKNITQGTGSQCGRHSQNTNRAPIPNAGRDYTIPAGTPFTLYGSANDPENNRLLYSWQQLDAGNRSAVNRDLGNNALFRARLATSSPSRTFPVLNDILNHRHTKGETLPNTQRILNFKLTVQDGNNNTSSDDVQLHIQNTGSRFALDLPYSHYTLGENSTLSWNVAKTNQAPINCSHVDITLSTDGGRSFGTLLASNIINNGSTSLYIPNNIPSSTQGRFKISCSNNIFFAISYHDFTLSSRSSKHNTPLSQEPNLTINSNQPIATSSTTIQSSSTSSKKSGGSFSLLLMILLGITIYLGRLPVAKKAYISNNRHS